MGARQSAITGFLDYSYRSRCDAPCCCRLPCRRQIRRGFDLLATRPKRSLAPSRHRKRRQVKHLSLGGRRPHKWTYL